MVLFASAVISVTNTCRLFYVAVLQFYRETMEVSDDVKSDTVAESKTTSLDNSSTEEVAAAVTDTSDVDMKTEPG